MDRGPLSAVPALRPPADAGWVTVAGCRVRWVAWGDPGAAPVVLVHGARANWHWWQAAAGTIAAAGRRAVALDLSGHGESGHRRAYDPGRWAAEVAAVIEASVGAPTAVAGHSMGGLVGIAAAARHPALVSALVLVDVKVQIPDPETGSAPRGSAARPLRTYDSLAAAVDSFRLLPEQPVVNRELLRHVASKSAVEAGGGWRWRFDPAIAQRFDDDSIAADLGRVTCPVHVVRGLQSGLVSPQTALDTATLLGSEVGLSEIPGAHHHVILDRPEAVGLAVDRALARGG